MEKKNDEIRQTTHELPKPAARRSASDGEAPAAEPAFVIDGRDLAFLRSIGIDPTRRRRGRRRDG
jgi:hypothetical protein